MMVVLPMPSIGKQEWHIYIVYVPPHTLYLWFGLLAMFRARAAEVWWLLIDSQDFRGLGRSGMFASQAAPHLFPLGFFALYLNGNCVGVPKSCWQCSLKVPGTPLTNHYKVTIVWISSFTPLNINICCFVSLTCISVPKIGKKHNIFGIAGKLLMRRTKLLHF